LRDNRVDTISRAGLGALLFFIVLDFIVLDHLRSQMTTSANPSELRFERAAERYREHHETCAMFRTEDNEFVKESMLAMTT